MYLQHIAEHTWHFSSAEMSLKQMQFQILAIVYFLQKILALQWHIIQPHMLTQINCTFWHNFAVNLQGTTAGSNLQLFNHGLACQILKWQFQTCFFKCTCSSLWAFTFSFEAHASFQQCIAKFIKISIMHIFTLKIWKVGKVNMKINSCCCVSFHFTIWNSKCASIAPIVVAFCSEFLLQLFGTAKFFDASRLNFQHLSAFKITQKADWTLCCIQNA